MKVLVAILLSLGCGGRLTPTPEGGASNAYQIAYVGPENKIFVWHSKTESSTPLGDYGGNPCFTPSGVGLVVVPMSSEALLPKVTILSKDAGIAVIPLAEVVQSPCARDDGQRVLLGGAENSSGNCIAAYDVSTATSKQLTCNAMRAMYAFDNRTVVLSRSIDSASDEVVTMTDDGAAEVIVVPPATNTLIRDPAFSFDGSSVVFARGVLADDGFASDWEIDVADRGNGVIHTITTVVGDKATSSPRFTPDGSAIVFVTRSPQDASNYAVKIVDVTTGKVRTLIDDLAEIPLVYVGPQWSISVAPDP